MPFTRSPYLGPLLVAIAAILWSTDALYRFPAAHGTSAVWIVFAEHLLAMSVFIPWILAKGARFAFQLKPSEWILCFVVGAGGSALATILFTASFKHINPSVSILLQKLQPIFVILLAWVFLGERPSRKFYLWALVAILSASILTFPDLDFASAFRGLDPRSRGVWFSLEACGLWAVATVAGKRLLRRIDPNLATFWRFALGTLASWFLLVASGSDARWDLFFQGEHFKAYAYMGIMTGILPMVFYYQGMKRTTAGVVTITELLFPISAVIVNHFFLSSPINAVQSLSGAVLIFSVVMISRSPAARAT